MKNILGTAGALIKKHVRLFGAAGVLILFVIMLSAANGKSVMVDMRDIELDAEDGVEEFQVDAFEDINKLIENYLNAYMSGDTDEIELYAQPVSDTEKSYIEFYSDYVDHVENIVCYTKSGIQEGEYIVSVYEEIVFYGVKTRAPALDFYYVRTDEEDGSLYIDNAYSLFNQSNQEATTDPDITALIDEFKNTADMVTLKEEVQSRYTKAVGSDSDLNVMMTETIPNAIAQWAAELSKQAEEAASHEEDTVSGDAVSGDTVSGDSTGIDAVSGDDIDNPENTGAVKYTRMITTDSIKLRAEPSTDADVLELINKGENMKVDLDSENDEGWVKVVYNDRDGYVKREYLKKPKKPNSTEGEGTTETADDGSSESTGESAIVIPAGKEIILIENVNIRKSMSKDSDKMGTAMMGDKIKVIMSYAEGWTKVEWKDKTGYILSELLQNY